MGKVDFVLAVLVVMTFIYSVKAVGGYITSRRNKRVIDVWSSAMNGISDKVSALSEVIRELEGAHPNAQFFVNYSLIHEKALLDFDTEHPDVYMFPAMFENRRVHYIVTVNGSSNKAAGVVYELLDGTYAVNYGLTTTSEVKLYTVDFVINPIGQSNALPADDEYASQYLSLTV